MNMPATYAVYLAVSAAVTIWVGQTLHRRGRIFLVHTFGGDDSLADSVNHLLVVGFYLINFGYVMLALRIGTKPNSLEGSIEYLSTKIGLVMLILGAMHFFNLWAFAQWRNRHHRKISAGYPTASPFAPTDYARLREVTKF